MESDGLEKRLAAIEAQQEEIMTLLVAISRAFRGGSALDSVPVAGNDVVSTAFETAVVIDVLANDFDPDGTLVPSSVAILTNGVRGTAVANIDGTVTYTPGVSESGEDSFTYTVDDDDGHTSEPATVTVTIEAEAQVDAYGALVQGAGTLVFWHRFKEASGTTLQDSSGNGITGTYVGAAQFAQPGLVTDGDGSSVQFSSSSYALVDNNVAWTRNTFTWTVIAKASSSAIANGGYIVAANEDGENAGDIGLRFTSDGTGRLRWWGDGPSFQAAETASPVIEADTPFTVTIRCDATSMDVICNGVLVGTLPHTVGMFGNTTSIQYAYRSLSGESYDVTFDESFMHEEALSLAGIQGLHEHDPISIDPPLGEAHNAVGALSIDSLTPARTVNVSNSSQLSSALSSAWPGDHIILANGSYSAPDPISLTGTQGNPIVIRSANPHGATITNGFTAQGSWFIFSRLRFSSVLLLGADCRMSRSYLNNLTVQGPARRVTIDYNEVRDYNGRGIWMRQNPSPGVMEDLWVHHNYVVDPASGDDSAINLTGGDLESSHGHKHNALFEYNLVEGCLSSTSIGSKTSGVTIRFNTVRNCPNGGVVSRHGFENKLIGNSTINSPGTSAYGARHQLIGNYHSGPSGNWFASGLMWGTLRAQDWPEPPYYEAAEECVAVGNIGPFRVGMGSSSWDVLALNNEIWDHTGDVILMDGRHTGTLDNRNTPHPTIAVPQYVILQPSDVGPLAP